MSGCIRQLDAMKDAGVPIETMAPLSKYVVFRGGLKMPIRWIGEDGNLTDNRDEAVAYEFGDEEFGFGTVPYNIMDYDPQGAQEH
jgi:glutamate synthase domain-containing protein 2